MTKLGDRWVQTGSTWDVGAMEADEPEPTAGDSWAASDLADNGGQQDETARAIFDAANVITAYATEEGVYPEQSDGLSVFDGVAIAISAHPALSAYDAFEDIPTQNAWNDSFLYWSDTDSYILVSIGPDREMDQDWIENRQPIDLGGDDIVHADGAFIFLPEGVEEPVWRH